MGERVRFTPHGAERAAQMGLTRRDIVDLLREETTVTWSTFKYGAERRVAIAGELAIVMSKDRRIITVLLHRQERWDRVVDKVST